MFDVAPTELLVLGTVALLVIPPKDLPKAMRVAGYWIGKARGAARQFRSGFDNIVREAELQEMEKRWAAENDRIMREHPAEPAALASTGPIDTENDDSDMLPPENVDIGGPPPVMVEQPAVVPTADEAPPPKPRARRSKAPS